MSRCCRQISTFCTALTDRSSSWDSFETHHELIFEDNLFSTSVDDVDAHENELASPPAQLLQCAVLVAAEPDVTAMRHVVSAMVGVLSASSTATTAAKPGVTVRANMSMRQGFRRQIILIA